MRKTVVWLAAGCCMALSVLGMSCAVSETTANITSESGDSVVITETEGTANATETVYPSFSGNSRYGGIITLTLDTEPVLDLFGSRISAPQLLVHQRMIDGDWSKGLAGGYGEGLTDWGESTNIPYCNTGCLAEDVKWEISEDGSEITTTFIMRNDLHFADVESEAGDIVNGREVTIDDIVWNWNQRLHNEDAQNYQLYPAFRYPEAVKISENSFTVTHAFNDHLVALLRENASTVIFPPELLDTYGYAACTDWRYSVGTGPFILTDYVAGSMVELERNPDYWMTDPAGPGKGNPLPYADKVQYIIMEDAATRLAAFKTGSIDVISDRSAGEKDELLAADPYIVAAAAGSRAQNPLFMRTDLDRFGDIRVRKALMMAIDFQAINNDLYDGEGQIISWPYYEAAGYEPLSVTLDDPDLPESVWQLYSHDVDTAQRLIKEAGYPYGFSTTIIMQESDRSYYEMIAGMWEKIGVDVEMTCVDFGTLVSNAAMVVYTDMIVVGTPPDSSFPEQLHYAERNWFNASLINESYIDEAAAHIRTVAVTDFGTAMTECRPLIMNLLDQAYVIPTPRYPVYTMWWPWVKNYSGERSVGYFSADTWVQFAWVDRNLKTALGY